MLPNCFNSTKYDTYSFNSLNKLFQTIIQDRLPPLSALLLCLFDCVRRTVFSVYFLLRTGERGLNIIIVLFRESQIMIIIKQFKLKKQFYQIKSYYKAKTRTRQTAFLSMECNIIFQTALSRIIIVWFYIKGQNRHFFFDSWSKWLLSNYVTLLDLSAHFLIISTATDLITNSKR